MKGLFITGTDTEVGKTWVTVALAHALRSAGFTVAAMKPVASGGQWRGTRLVNEDALALAAASSLDAPYRRVNPYVYEPPVAPHLAAADRGETIALAPILEAADGLAAGADALLVEAVGGWKVPLGPDLDVPALARAFGLPVLLVVGVRLGCISHALLTAEAVARDGCPLAGWVANRIEPTTLMADRVVAALAERLPAPLIADLPFAPPEPAPQGPPRLSPPELRRLLAAIERP